MEPIKPFLWLACLLQVSIALSRGQQKNVMTIKLAVFVDAALQRHIENNLKIFSTEKLEQLVEAYIWQVESNFAGLRGGTFGGLRLELAGIRPYKPKKQPSGDVDRLLGDFCDHQSQERQRGAGDGWQLSLLLTSLDLFSYEDAQEYGSMEESQSTMGISVIDGINWPELGCLIVEFGVNYNRPLRDNSTRHHATGCTDRKYLNPSRGFGSTWVATHEIGHSLGIHHDGPPFNAECEPSDGWVMSPGSLVESISLLWSECSLSRINELTRTIDSVKDSARRQVVIDKLPGQIFDLNTQCETFASDLEVAFVSPLESICNKTAWCQPRTGTSEQSNRTEPVAIGPALDGTICDEEGSMMCFEQKCTTINGLST